MYSTLRDFISTLREGATICVKGECLRIVSLTFADVICTSLDEREYVCFSYKELYDLCKGE